MLDEIIAPLLTTEWGKRLGLSVLILLLLLLLYIVFDTVWDWHADYKLIETAPIKKIDVPIMQDKVKELPGLHLFGQYTTVPQAVLPVTSLQLRLVGVIKSVPEKYSRVIISEQDRPAKVYQIGDTLSSGVRIHSITAEGVILENGGRLEKLPLQRTPLNFQGMPKNLLPNDNR